MRPKWNKLDNAAKLYPAASTKADTHVFRFSCELYEDVDPEILQAALDETIKFFPVYQYILKRGLFWYYLETTSLLPVVKEEYKPPCNEIYDKNQKTLLYEVTYFSNIINLEMYHVLTDGTGAINFLKNIITKYFSKKYGLGELSIDYDASHTQMADDSFSRYSGKNNPDIKKVKNPKAHKLTGPKYSENRIKIIRGSLPLKKVLETAHEHHSTLTAFLAGCLIQAIHEEMPNHQKKFPVVLSIPVNLRNYFKSESARNFFGIVYTKYDFFEKTAVLDDLLNKINDDFQKELTSEKIKAMINSNNKLEKNVFVRLAPLFFKDFVLKIGYKHTSSRSTATLSNVGIIKIDDKISQYVRSIDVCTGTNRLQVCICSFKDKLSISFTSPFINSDIQRCFFRTLSQFGIDVEISANQIADE